MEGGRGGGAFRTIHITRCKLAHVFLAKPADKRLFGCKTDAYFVTIRYTILYRNDGCLLLLLCCLMSSNVG